MTYSVRHRGTQGVKVYMTDFFKFARLNLPNVLISVAKNFSIAIFLPRVLCQKLPVGYKTATPKQGTPSLAKNRFLSHFLIVS